MGKIKRPAITDKKMMSLVAQRTSIPINTIITVIAAYHDIIKRCIEQEVEVKMGELGTVTWKTMKARHGVVFYDFGKKGPTEPMDVPEHRLPSFRFNSGWNKDLREKTSIWEDEEGAGENAL